MFATNVGKLKPVKFSYSFYYEYFVSKVSLKVAKIVSGKLNFHISKYSFYKVNSVAVQRVFL